MDFAILGEVARLNWHRAVFSAARRRAVLDRENLVDRGGGCDFVGEPDEATDEQTRAYRDEDVAEHLGGFPGQLQVVPIRSVADMADGAFQCRCDLLSVP